MHRHEHCIQFFCCCFRGQCIHNLYISNLLMILTANAERMCQNKEGNNALTMQIDNIFKNIYRVCSLLFITYFVLFVQCTYYCRAIAVCVPFLNSVRAFLLLHQIILRACKSIWNWLFVIATAAIIYIHTTFDRSIWLCDCCVLFFQPHAFNSNRKKPFPFCWSKKPSHNYIPVWSKLILMGFRSSSGYQINRAIMSFNNLCPIKVDMCVHFSTSMTPLVWNECTQSSVFNELEGFIHLECKTLCLPNWGIWFIFAFLVIVYATFYSAISFKTINITIFFTYAWIRRQFQPFHEMDSKYQHTQYGHIWISNSQPQWFYPTSWNVKSINGNWITVS